MKERQQALIAKWNEDKLWGSLAVLWTATVFFAFLGADLLRITLPAIGTLFPFRILLPVSAVLYILYAIREKEHVWKDASTIERWCYILIIILAVYSVASLPRALDFMFTFRRLFNLCFDLCFFFLLLRLLKDERLRRASFCACAAALVLIFLLGLCEIYAAGPYTSEHPFSNYFFFFNHVRKSPRFGLSNPNDYASGMVFTACVLFLALTARWSKAGKKIHWAMAAGLALLYAVTMMDCARLAKIGLWLLLTGFVIFLLISDRRRLWIPLVSLVLISGIWFGNQYRYIMPSIRTYLIQWEEYRQQQSNPEIPGSQKPDQPPPKLQIETEPSESLDEQFFVTNSETGEKTLQTKSSAGVRAHLLIHAYNCFVESYGFGIGLGNTETLAPRRNIVPAWVDMPQNSIHCFPVRIIADYGLFVLIPLCVIALLLLKAILTALRTGINTRDKGFIGYTLLYLCVLLTYPLLSTASSDAQDSLPMWIYLAVVALVPLWLQPCTENGIPEPLAATEKHPSQNT